MSGAAMSVVQNSATAEQNSKHIVLCKQYLTLYKADEPTVAEMRHYSACVDKLYPKQSEMAGSEVLLLKAAIVVVFASIAFGAWTQRHAFDRLDGILRGAFLGLVISLLSLTGIAVAVEAVIFLFS